MVGEEDLGVKGAMEPNLDLNSLPNLYDPLHYSWRTAYAAAASETIYCLSCPAVVFFIGVIRGARLR